MNWITESNRQKHFLYAMPQANPPTNKTVSRKAHGMEFKDRAYGGKWDWLDILATILGGIVGQMLQVLLIYILKCVC